MSCEIIKVCKFDMRKVCIEQDCVCDEDVTDVTDFEHLREALDFNNKNGVEGDD